MDIMCYQHLKTKNDRNGNPRRLWVAYNYRGNVCEVIDEGYSGRPYHLKDKLEILEVEIPVYEYDEIIGRAKVNGYLRRS